MNTTKKKKSRKKQSKHRPKYIALSDKKLELLCYGYVRQQKNKLDINKIIPIDLFKLIYELNGLYEMFDCNNYTKSSIRGKKGLIFSEDNCTISQNDSITRSVLGTIEIEKGHSFYWEFLISEWSGHCCRIGIISSDTNANGSIWSKPDAVLMCIQSGCWRSIWTQSTCINYVPYRDPFKNNDKLSIKIEWKKKRKRHNIICQVSFYHNGNPLDKAQKVETSLDTVSIFVELCGKCKVEILDAKYLD